ncbi:SMI1/KNR4 family protein [Kaarinaea lacus]
MDECERLKKSWVKIEHWLSENFPESLDHIQAPTTDAKLSETESLTGLRFPNAYKTLLLTHNGEHSQAPIGIFPDGHKLLSLDAIREKWRSLKQSSATTPQNDEAQSYWRAQIDDHMLSISGPVKPTYGSEKWLPISTAQANTMRFLDFDPPEGGTIGQVIEADPDLGIYQVLAPSFIHYIEQYAIDLLVNKYVVVADQIRLEHNTPSDPLSWEIPNYLRGTDSQNNVSDEKLEQPAPTHLESGERLLIVGEMTSLMGKDEILFSIITEQSKEYTFLAKPAFTNGFDSIAINQHARVYAKKFYGEINSHFIEQGLAKRPDFIALEYTTLRTSKSKAKTVSAPTTKHKRKIDQLAEDILISARNNFPARHNYEEIKFDRMTHLHTKFYNDTTARFLKLGFHYIGDFVEHSYTKNKATSLKLFHVMSFFDDGVVASFYQNKTKIPWPFQSQGKVIEFETEFSDGHIIRSSNAAEKTTLPVPSSISQFGHPANIPLEGLLHKHRSKIRRYQSKNPQSNIVKVRNISEFLALEDRRQQMLHDYLLSIGWVTKEYLAEKLNNKKIASQVYERIQQMARN